MSSYVMSGDPVYTYVPSNERRRKFDAAGAAEG